MNYPLSIQFEGSGNQEAYQFKEFLLDKQRFGDYTEISEQRVPSPVTILKILLHGSNVTTYVISELITYLFQFFDSKKLFNRSVSLAYKDTSIIINKENLKERVELIRSDFFVFYDNSPITVNVNTIGNFLMERLNPKKVGTLIIKTKDKELLVNEVLSFLNEFNIAYDKLARFNSINNHNDIINFLTGYHNKATNKLIIKSITVASPGIWEFIGNLNPFQQIREYLKDRHERKLDIEYRIRHYDKEKKLENEKKEKMMKHEIEAAVLKNMLIKDQILKNRIEIIKSLDLAKDKEEFLIQQAFVNPLLAIGEMQDEGIVSTVELEE